MTDTQTFTTIDDLKLWLNDFSGSVGWGDADTGQTHDDAIGKLAAQLSHEASVDGYVWTGGNGEEDWSEFLDKIDGERCFAFLDGTGGQITETNPER